MWHWCWHIGALSQAKSSSWPEKVRNHRPFLKSPSYQISLSLFPEDLFFIFHTTVDFPPVPPPPLLLSAIIGIYRHKNKWGKLSLSWATDDYDKWEKFKTPQSIIFNLWYQNIVSRQRYWGQMREIREGNP